MLSRVKSSLRDANFAKNTLQNTQNGKFSPFCANFASIPYYSLNHRQCQLIGLRKTKKSLKTCPVSEKSCHLRTFALGSPASAWDPPARHYAGTPPHHLTSSPPHHLTTSPPHLLTTSPPHLLTSSPPHLLTTSPPHLLTSSPPHYLTTPLPHYLTTSLPHYLTTSSPHHLTDGCSC